MVWDGLLLQPGLMFRIAFSNIEVRLESGGIEQNLLVAVESFPFKLIRWLSSRFRWNDNESK